MGSRALSVMVALSVLAPSAASARGLTDYKQLALREAVAHTVRNAILAHFQHTKAVRPPAVLDTPSSGVFVTFSRHGVTRACWGTVEPRHDTLSEEIAFNAENALTHDYRHAPIQATELAGLEAHVSVLGDLEPVDGPSQLQPRRYGLLVAGPGKGGVLLPGEAATATWQIATCRKKAGLRPRDRARLYRFETAVIGPISLAPGEPTDGRR